MVVRLLHYTERERERERDAYLQTTGQLSELSFLTSIPI